MVARTHQCDTGGGVVQKWSIVFHAFDASAAVFPCKICTRLGGSIDESLTARGLVLQLECPDPRRQSRNRGLNKAKCELAMSRPHRSTNDDQDIGDLDAEDLACAGLKRADRPDFFEEISREERLRLLHELVTD